VAAWVITCSDSRSSAQDESGDAIAQALEAAGHTLAGRSWVKDDPAEIRVALEKGVENGARAVILTGGTGLSRRDVTADTVEALFERHLPGFGELFRMLSFQEIGSAAMLSRATAGTWRGAVVFAVPGSPAGARLATSRLIAPELSHLLREISR
jgi:molybdenum cofactor biosynthesis protein B